MAERLRFLRESVRLSQVKMAEIVGVKQSSLNRYELNQTSPTFETLTRYADYFDVSIDYIFGRTDNPQGKLYEYKPKIQQSDPQMQKFVEMCFDPTSPMNDSRKHCCGCLGRRNNECCHLCHTPVILDEQPLRDSSIPL
ncbi:MAG: helix-turn-helix domain-containing protein [Eubacteriales bacterium]